MNYVFGYIFYAKKLDFIGDPTIAIPRTENRLVISDMMYQLGIQYKYEYLNKYFITLGGVLENETKLKTRSHFLSELYFPGRSTSISDSITLPSTYLIAEEESKGSVVYPRNIGLGISMGIKDMLTITGDFYVQNWNKSLIMGKSDSLVNSSSVHLGIEFTPSSTSIRSYLGRVNYRFGGFFTNSYISIRNKQLKDNGMTFGVGLPLRNTKTTFNVGCILGQRGTLQNELIKEQYGIVHFGVTFHDIWFRKRKYD